MSYQETLQALLALVGHRVFIYVSPALPAVPDVVVAFSGRLRSAIEPTHGHRGKAAGEELIFWVGEPEPDKQGCFLLREQTFSDARWEADELDPDFPSLVIEGAGIAIRIQEPSERRGTAR